LRADAEELMKDRAPEGRLLERDLKVLSQPRLKARAKVRHGFVVDEILKEARLGDYDLIIIGAHQREGWESLLLENIARKIVIMADRPVLVVRSQAEGPPGEDR
jgi:nucleotide-binding universal stress UspA family protein